MACDSFSGFFSHFRLGVLHISLHIRKIQPRGWKKNNKRTSTDLGQLQTQEREFVTLCILCVSVDYRRRVFCEKLLQKPRGMLTHLCLLSLPPSADRPSLGLLSHTDWSLLPCVVNCSLCLLWDLPSIVHFRSRRRSSPPSIVWVSRQNRQRDRMNGAHTNGNELLRIVSQTYKG